jgi:hypothetical protein
MSGAFEQELVEGCACEFVFYAATAIKIPATNGNGNGIGLHDDFNVSFTVFV